MKKTETETNNKQQTQTQTIKHMKFEILKEEEKRVEFFYKQADKKLCIHTLVASCIICLYSVGILSEIDTIQKINSHFHLPHLLEAIISLFLIVANIKAAIYILKRTIENTEIAHINYKRAEARLFKILKEQEKF